MSVTYTEGTLVITDFYFLIKSKKKEFILCNLRQKLLCCSRILLYISVNR